MFLRGRLVSIILGLNCTKTWLALAFDILLSASGGLPNDGLANGAPKLFGFILADS